IESKYLHAKALYPAMTTTTLIADGTFASGITGWTATNGSAAHETSVTHLGANSLRLTASSSSAKVEYTTASVTSGLHKLVEIYVKGNASAVGKFIRSKITANGDATTQDTWALKLTADWQKLWCSYTIPATGTLKFGVES